MLCPNCNRLIVLRSNKILPGKLFRCVNCNFMLVYEENNLNVASDTENLSFWQKIKNLF